MLHKYAKTILFSVCVIASSIQAQEDVALECHDGEVVVKDSATGLRACSPCSSSDSDGDCNNLKLKSLTAKKIKSHCLSSKSITAKSVCSESVSTDALCAKTINLSEGFCAANIKTPSLCAGDVRATNICANAILANSFEQCGKFRATAAFSMNSTYTLGTPVNFDDILDDPNGNMALGPTRYIAPRNGYYIVSLQFDQTNLTGSSLVLGIPVTNLQVLVNGVVFRETFVPYLSFHNAQNATISALISLKTGDVVTSRQNVLVLTDSGFAPYVGTVDVLGDGTEAFSVFKIHLLSNDCPPQLCESACDTICTPTSACLPCSSVHTPCER